MKNKMVSILALVLALCIALPALAAPPAYLSQGAFAAHPDAKDTIKASSGVAFMPVSDQYVVFRQKNGNYIVFLQDETAWGYSGKDAPDTPLFRIEKDRKHRTTALYMYTGDASGPLYRIYGDPDTKTLSFHCVGSSVPKYKAGDRIPSDSGAYQRLKSRYELHFEKGLGLSAFLEGNVLKDADWVEMAEKGDVSATVKFGKVK